MLAKGRMAIWILALMLAAAALLMTGCTTGSTDDVLATVVAELTRVAEEATRTAPTPTPTPSPSPTPRPLAPADVPATVMAALTRVAEEATRTAPTPTPQPTATPIPPTATPTPTPHPTATLIPPTPTPTPRPTATLAPGVTRDFSCLSRNSGMVCWGWNVDGQATPLTENFQQVSAGDAHTAG